MGKQTGERVEEDLNDAFVLTASCADESMIGPDKVQCAISVKALKHESDTMGSSVVHMGRSGSQIEEEEVEVEGDDDGLIKAQLTLRIPKEVQGHVSFGEQLSFPRDFECQMSDEFTCVVKLPVIETEATRTFNVPINFNDSCESAEPGYTFLEVTLEILNRPQASTDLYERKNFCQVLANTDRVSLHDKKRNQGRIASLARTMGRKFGSNSTSP